MNGKEDCRLLDPNVASHCKYRGYNNYPYMLYGQEYSLYGRDRLVHSDISYKGIQTLHFATNVYSLNSTLFPTTYPLNHNGRNGTSLFSSS